MGIIVSIISIFIFIIVVSVIVVIVKSIMKSVIGAEKTKQIGKDINSGIFGILSILFLILSCIIILFFVLYTGNILKVPMIPRLIIIIFIIIALTFHILKKRNKL